MSDSYDVVIIGAGLCGLSAARAASSRPEISVALLDAGESGSGGLSCLTFTPVLLDHDLLDCARIAYRSFAFHNFQGSSIQFLFDYDALCVLDYGKACLKLRNALLTLHKNCTFIQARATAVLPHDKTVTVHTDREQTLCARICIDCSGSRQFTATRSNQGRAAYYSNVYGALFSGVSPEAFSLGALLLPHQAFGNGGGWYYPLGGGKISFGYASISAEPLADARVLRENFERAWRTFTPYADFLRAAHIERIEAGIIPIQYTPRMTRGNILIAGDAAGMASSWTCMGVESALQYGRLAGAVAAHALHNSTSAGLGDFEVVWMHANKKIHDAFSRHARLFWNGNHYFWEWIIKNDLSHLTPRQMLERMRYNKHLPGPPRRFLRAVRFKIKASIRRSTAQPLHITVEKSKRLTGYYCREITACSTPQLTGMKGANLHILAASGFPIPRTFVLMSEAYKLFIRSNGIDVRIDEILKHPSLSNGEKSERIAFFFYNAEIPAPIIEEVAQNPLLNAAGSSWAVRSSSNLEDRPDASFAGLYDSDLNVQGAEHMIRAVRKCWASLWSERALAYRPRTRLKNEEVLMAVLIQEMVNARYGGVIFTRDPLSRGEGEIILEYCPGGGAAVVSGLITPATCRLPRTFSSRSSDGPNFQGDFGKEEVVRLVELALHAERILEQPQDIEWAYDGTSFSLLQSRPISIIARRSPAPVWTRANIGEVLPGAVTPLTWNLFLATLTGRFDADRATADPEQPGQAAGIGRFHGRVYIRLDTFCKTFCYLPFVGPQTLHRSLGVNFPEPVGELQRPRGIAVRAAQGYFLLNILRSSNYCHGITRKLPEVPSHPGADLAGLVAWNARCFRLHLKATAYAIGAFALLEHCLEKWVAGDVLESLPLMLRGLEDLKTAAQGLSLHEMAAEANRSESVRAALLGDAPWPLLQQALAGTDAGVRFLALLNTFLAIYGARAAGEFELAQPRWCEDPSFPLAVIRRFLKCGDMLCLGREEKARDQQRAAIRMVRAALRHSYQRIFFDRLVASYRDFSARREHLKYRLMEGYAALRSLFLSRGTALVDKGLLSAAADVFFLTPDEIESALQTGLNCKTIARERRVVHEALEKESAPELVFDNGEGIACAGVSPLTGIGCSPGCIRGTARIISDIAESANLQHGEILVTSHTDPGWTPLFLSCGGIVTEIGGFLSHGSTVAREYGIPMVSNVKNATTTIQTGSLIEVDGTRGRVAIIYRQ